MLFKNITILDENFEVKEGMFVGTCGDKISYIGANEPSDKDAYGEEYDGRGKLLLPTFYNTHSHLAMSYLRGYGENLPLSEWLNNKIFPFEGKYQEGDIYYGTLLGVAEMLRFGIGSTSEMYLSYPESGKALDEAGVKANFCNCGMSFDGGSYKDSKYYGELLDAIDKYERYDNGRLHVDASLHAEYTSHESFAKELANEAKIRGLRMQVHVSETANEVEECKARHEGRTPVRYLADCGIFDVPTTAAHCVHLTDDDIRILKDKGVTVAHNPKSNLKLASGICNVSALLDAGVNVTIGTDSVASNNNLNFIEEMRVASLIQKVRDFDPTAITPSQLLYMATRAGALSQGRDDSGLIKEGFKADITVMDIDKIYMKPSHSVINNLVFSSQGTDVVLTMIDGKVLYKDGNYTTLDIDALTKEVEKRRIRILEAL